MDMIQGSGLNPGVYVHHRGYRVPADHQSLWAAAAGGGGPVSWKCAMRDGRPTTFRPWLRASLWRATGSIFRVNPKP